MQFFQEIAFRFTSSQYAAMFYGVDGKQLNLTHMEFTLSKHAEEAIKERGIHLEWVAMTLTEPTAFERHPDDPDLRHALRPIGDFGYRVLSVIYNESRDPVHVVTAYFDRSIKGKL